MSSRKENKCWWGYEQEVTESPVSSRSRDFRSSGSSTSMFSCIGSDVSSDSYALARDFSSKYESRRPCERIELTSLRRNDVDVDVDLIEQDARIRELDVKKIHAEDRAEALPERCKPQAFCYTPERLIRSQEYRILTPSPRHLAALQGKVSPESHESSHRTRRCRRRLSYLLDSNQVGSSQLKAILDSAYPEIRTTPTSSYDWGNEETGRRHSTPETGNRNFSTVPNHQFMLPLPEANSSRRSSYESSVLNVTWEDWKKPGGTRRSSFEDTSGIHSYDWSSDTHSDVNTPLRLSDELAIATRNYKSDLMQEKGAPINKVVSILERLDSDPEKATLLLDEDRFCDSTSSHDQLTRLALAIETDGSVPEVLGDPEDLVRHLRGKVEKLQVANKDMYRDIRNLQKNFQSDEKKIVDITANATKLKEDIHEVRYLDDLLFLLQGELERISKRNWPFVLGRSEHHTEDMNLVI